MLRIAWILPGGGVLLAIVLVALVFSAPDRSHSQLMPNVARIACCDDRAGQASGMAAVSHSWRANQRANELNSLYELPDAPVTDTAPAAPTIAHLPADRGADPEDNNDEIVLSVQAPTATVPVDVGAFLSVQPVPTQEENQPVAIREEKPAVATLDRAVTTSDKKSAVIRTPQRVKSPNQSLAKGVQRVRSRARAPGKQEQPSSQYFFDPFGNQQAGQTYTPNANNYFGNQQAGQTHTPNANNYFGNQQAGQTHTPNASDY